MGVFFLKVLCRVCAFQKRGKRYKQTKLKGAIFAATPNIASKIVFYLKKKKENEDKLRKKFIFSAH